jgi:hypothetical protein
VADFGINAVEYSGYTTGKLISLYVAWVGMTRNEYKILVGKPQNKM